MKDDLSNVITDASCYTISNDYSIYAYKSNMRYTYVRVGSKWYNTGTQQYTNLPVNSTCYNFSDISTINSYHVWEPIYITLALVFVVFVWLLWFSVFKRITRWKV